MARRGDGAGGRRRGPGATAEAAAPAEDFREAGGEGAPGGEPEADGGGEEAGGSAGAA
jgi:hypothetical protein